VGTASSQFEPVLVATKLHVPRLRPGFVSRRELVARLVADRRSKLTLVCAPAGWGKSTLLGEWHAAPEERRPFAWLSLDPGDHDPVRFWSYAIAALRTVRPELGTAGSGALRSAGPDLVDVVVAPLINELAALSEPLVLSSTTTTSCAPSRCTSRSPSSFATCRPPCTSPSRAGPIPRFPSALCARPVR
jgi:ATP/maltotriose-dependent transcriptional regulator MalT